MSPTTSYYMITEADFRPRRGGDAVSFGLGNGGVRADPASTFGITAPMHLPHGATVTNVRVFLASGDPTLNVIVVVQVRSGEDGYFTWGRYETTGHPPSGGYVDVVSPAVEPLAVDNSKWEWTLLIDTGENGGGSKPWGDKLVVHRAVVTYTLPA